VESDSLPPSEPYSLVIYWFIFLSANYSFVILPLTLLIIFFLVLSALISGSEVAFFSLTPGQLELLKDSEDEKDKKILDLLDRPRFLLATLLISNNLVNVSVIILFSYLMNVLLPNLDETIITLVNVLALTPILVFFGEVSPKVFATHNNLFLARFTTNFIRFLRFVCYPISFLLVKSGLFIEKKFNSLSHEIDIDEIEKAIDLSSTDGSTQEDVNILKGIINFGNTTVKQIMIPRVDIVAVKMSYSFKEIMDKVNDTEYSRMPVYDQSIDKIEGVLYIKDLLEHIDEGENFEWQNLIREPFFIPETKKIDDLLRAIQVNRKHQAIVVDEYGGTKGLVTLEDILEEVLGDIRDEFDDEDSSSFKKVSSDTYIIDAKISLIDLCENLDLDEAVFEDFMAESGTLAGLILELSGELPKKGSELSYKNYFFKVISMEKNRIQKVKLKIQHV
jgi:putative hemolysin